MAINIANTPVPTANQKDTKAAIIKYFMCIHIQRIQLGNIQAKVHQFGTSSHSAPSLMEWLKMLEIGTHANLIAQYLAPSWTATWSAKPPKWPRHISRYEAKVDRRHL